MIRGAIAIAATLAAAPAAAETCNVDPQGVAFGAYDSLALDAVDGVGIIRVSCDSSVSFTVALGPGSGSIADRRMTSGGDALRYNLYSDAGRAALWGDGTGAADLSATGTTVDLNVYGRIPARQNLPAGSYGDTITVTVSF